MSGRFSNSRQLAVGSMVSSISTPSVTEGTLIASVPPSNSMNGVLGTGLRYGSADIGSGSGGGRWAVRVTKASAGSVPPEDLLEQLQGLCAHLNSLNLQKFDKCISKETHELIANSLERHIGFSIERRPSSLSNGGTGVCVSAGNVDKDKLVAIYPGTLYRPGEPVFIQSVANAYLFRCEDGILLDGCDRGLSRLIYTSCSYRDRHGPTLTSDMTWLSSRPVNPLNVGQYVNNHTTAHPANVAYQELDLLFSEFPPYLRRFIPIVYYSSQMDTLPSKQLLPCGQPFMFSPLLSTKMDREISVNIPKHRYPHSIVWTPIPVITWLFPFVGHMGICYSNGVIRDFAGSYYVSDDDMAFGWPSKYWQLSLDQVTGGSNAWDNAVTEASDEYKRHVHNLFCDNCHSHVALALNSMNYKGKRSWNMVTLATILFFKGKYVSVCGFLKQWLPFLIVVGIIAIVCIVTLR